jgi:protein TonB
VLFQRVQSVTRASDRRTLGLSVASLVVHAAIIGGAGAAVRGVAQGSASVRADTTVVFLEPHADPQSQPPALDVPARGFQTVVALAQIPTTVPPVDLATHFDPKDYSGTGVEGGTARGVVVTDSQIYAAAIVDEAPLLLSPPPPYPELMRQAGIAGRVLVQAVVDTTGRLEPASIRILESPSPGFERTTTEWARTARFRPARLRGRAVRVLVRQPVQFAREPSGG